MSSKPLNTTMRLIEMVDDSLRASISLDERIRRLEKKVVRLEQMTVREMINEPEDKTLGGFVLTEEETERILREVFGKPGRKDEA